MVCIQLSFSIYEQIIEQTELFNFGMEIGLGEGKLNSNMLKLILRYIRLVRRGWVNTCIQLETIVVSW